MRHSEQMGPFVTRVPRTGSTPGRRSGPRTEPDSPMATSAPAVPRADWIVAVQRLAGNRAVANEMTRLTVQREEPAPAAAASGATTAPSVGGPGREPTPAERVKWVTMLPNLTDFRIVVEPSYAFNCFAWALGETSREITSDTIFAFGHQATLDGWTNYLTVQRGFSRHADGLDSTADLILYGASPTQVSHAARKADEPMPPLTFTSKLGGQVLTPVVLHEPAAMVGGEYGKALRSFWRGEDVQAQPTTPAPTP